MCDMVFRLRVEQRVCCWQVSAVGELAVLGSALGESLVAADLAVIIAHKRQATLRRAPSSTFAGHGDDRFKSVDAHRCALFQLTLIPSTPIMCE